MDTFQNERRDIVWFDDTLTHWGLTFRNSFFFKEMICILIQISFKFVPTGPIHNISTHWFWQWLGAKQDFELIQWNVYLATSQAQRVCVWKAWCQAISKTVANYIRPAPDRNVSWANVGPTSGRHRRWSNLHCCLDPLHHKAESFTTHLD